ncbi:hypothetical protein AABB24_000564, partial [Solanum stoloniferum]
SINLRLPVTQSHQKKKKMRVVMNRLSRALWDFKRDSSSTKISRALSTCIQSKQWLPSPYRESRDSLFASPWSATQLRGAKSRGADLKPGNVIEKKRKDLSGGKGTTHNPRKRRSYYTGGTS